MESSDRKAHVCCDCKARSPETDTNYTLISSRYGWRLSRHVGSDGSFLVEWRCPRCWERYKQRKAGPGAGTDSIMPASLRSDSSAPPAESSRTVPPSSARPRRSSSAPPPRARSTPPLRAVSSSPPSRRKK